jgi:hypothetical protein
LVQVKQGDSQATQLTTWAEVEATAALAPADLVVVIAAAF